MTGYEAIDGKIQEWALRNSLHLFTSSGDEPIRLAHVSSEAGECFCISIGRPDEGIVRIAAGCIEGRNDLQPAEVWSYPIESISEGLAEVFQTVLARMAPSVRYFPPVEK
jgi:hypothetical protein